MKQTQNHGLKITVYLLQIIVMMNAAVNALGIN